MDDVDKNFIDALNALMHRDLGAIFRPMPYASVGILQISENETRDMFRYENRYNIAPPVNIEFDLRFVLIPGIVMVDPEKLKPVSNARQGYDYEGTATEAPPEIEQ